MKSVSCTIAHHCQTIYLLLVADSGVHFETSLVYFPFLPFGLDHELKTIFTIFVGAALVNIPVTLLFVVFL